MKNQEIMPPAYDPDMEPILDINGIQQLLPHRYPMGLVDKVMELDDLQIVAVKNVTYNESFFQGHFPKDPVMPGVLVIEAMAQCGGILALSNVSSPELYSTYFLSIKNARFKKKIVPGDTLKFHVKYTSPIKRGIASMHGCCFVGTKLVAEAEFTAMITKN